MISSEVQRTLVKSPPELWAELSDPEALARHLDALGRVRITAVEPESKVEWESEDARGCVTINPSGWGTKVTLTVTRELAPAQQPMEAEPERVPRPIVVAEPERVPEPIVAAEPLPAAGPTIAPEPAPIDAEPPSDAGRHDEPPNDAVREPEADAAAAAPQPAPQFPDVDDSARTPAAGPTRRGLFARLRAWLTGDVPPTSSGERTVETDTHAEAPASLDAVAHETLVVEVLDETSGETVWEAVEPYADGATAEGLAAPGPLSPEPDPAHVAIAATPQPSETLLPASPAAGGGHDPVGPDDGATARGAAEIAAELRAAEETAAEEVRAVLTAVLDRLGAAHHRPFSRP